jgi:lipid II isoglutaminyl synthase (glutamine-hydrolysing)
MYNSFILSLLIIYARCVSWLIRLFGRSSGTSLPGLLVESYCPWVLGLLSSRYKHIVFISGTNGKTTTRSALVTICQESGVTVCTNRGGANIMRGLSATLLLDQKIFAGSAFSDYLILEVEEATLPRLSKFITPNTLILTNIFRDQLDAYGEIDNTLAFFSQALGYCDPLHTTVLANSDDTKLLSSLIGFSGEIYGFSILSDESDTIRYEGASSTNPVVFSRVYTGELKDNGLQIDFDSNPTIPVHLPGRYNLYNLLAATVVGVWLFGNNALNCVSKITPAFGRGEKVLLGETEIEMLLIKNPAGFEETLKYISKDDSTFSVAFVINDNIADGRDVSWLWDVDLELYSQLESIHKVYTSGTRGMDMLLRLEYAGFHVKSRYCVFDYKRLINKMESSKCNRWYVLCTYTSLLGFRKELGQRVNLPDISANGN